MLAIQVDQPGGPEVLKVTDLPVPVCGTEQLLVELAFSGINFIDIYQRQGIYPMSSPYVPGLEGSGVVIEVGSAVTGFALGDKVAWPSSLGSYAQFHAVNATSVVKVPEGVSLDGACAAMLQGMAAEQGEYLVEQMQSAWIAFIHGRTPGWEPSPTVHVFE